MPSATFFWINRFIIGAENRSTELTTKSSAPPRIEIPEH